MLSGVICLSCLMDPDTLLGHVGLRPSQVGGVPRSGCMKRINFHVSLAAGIVGVCILAFLNAMVRPVLYLLSAPFIAVTLGLFMVIINACLLTFVSWLVKGFYVAGFWSAVGGAIFISLVSGILNLMISDRGKMEVVISSHRSRPIRHIN